MLTITTDTPGVRVYGASGTVSAMLPDASCTITLPVRGYLIDLTGTTPEQEQLIIDTMTSLRAALAFDTDARWDHPLLKDWQAEAANGDTMRGFGDWLASQAEIAGDRAAEEAAEQAGPPDPVLLHRFAVNQAELDLLLNALATLGNAAEGTDLARQAQALQTNLIHQTIAIG